MTWTPAMLDRLADHAVDPRIASVLEVAEGAGGLLPPVDASVWCLEGPAGEYLLLADTLDALAIATVIYRVSRRGRLTRRRRLPGALRVSSVAALSPSAPLPYVAAALRAQAPEALVVDFSADRTLAGRLKRVAVGAPCVVGRSGQRERTSYGATLAALPEAKRAERLAEDILGAVFADAREILHRLGGSGVTE